MPFKKAKPIKGAKTVTKPAFIKETSPGKKPASKKGAKK